MSFKLDKLFSSIYHPSHLDTFFYERFKLHFPDHTLIRFDIRTKLCFSIYKTINSITLKARAKTYEHNIQEPEARQAIL